MTYSPDFRRKALRVRKKENLNLAKVSKRFSVSLASVMRWSITLEAKIKRNKSATKIDMETLKNDVSMYPDAYPLRRELKGCM